MEERVTIEGRKFPLLSLRQQMLKDQEQYMRLQSDEQIQELPEEELRAHLANTLVPVSSTASKSELNKSCTQSQRNRTLMIWHDHASILGVGYVMITVNTVYEAVFLTTEECREKGITVCNLQSVVEQPYVYLLGAGSSSIEDQAALVGDRVECLHSLAQKLTTSNGISIKDTLHFFKGDTPAKQFECGTQIGGNYKCSCGIHTESMHDLTIALQYSGQPLSELQSIALGGKYGATPNSIKPFATLNANQLQDELRRRNVYHLATTKKDLNDILKGTLKGVQRVPTLLLTNPTGNLSDLNIDNYTVLESEPLHDIKGHLNNLFSKLPAVLEGDVKNTCKEIIDSNKRKDKVKCADLRLTAIQLFMFLRNKLPSTSNVVMLLDTVLRISEILYLPAIERYPKRILQMYNCTWIHHMLCKKIFPTTDTLYGSYCSTCSNAA